MDVVLGVSMNPSAVRMVLVEGESADGGSLDHDTFEITPDDTSANSGAPQQVLDAILGTRESAADGGHRLTSVGVAWTDHGEAARLRQGLRRHRLHDVVMVSELHAASALAQAIGQAVGSERTALLFVERDTATLAVVRTGDGAVVRVLSRSLNSGDVPAEVQGMVAGLAGGEEPAQAVFVVGSGVDIAALRPLIAAASGLPVHAPDDGDLALARGAALAAASTPRYEASTVGMTSSEDTAAGPTQMAAAGYMAPLGYSAAPDDEDADLFGYDGPAIDVDPEPDEPDRKSFVLVGSALSTIFVVGVAALAVSLAVVVRPTADPRPGPAGSPVVSSAPAAAPVEAADVAPPVAPETIQAPVPVVQVAPRTVVVAPPAAPAPALAAVPEAAPAPVATPPAPEGPPPVAAPAPAPAAVPEVAPAPAPVAPAPAAPPIVLPVPIVLPPIFQAPARTVPVPRSPRSPRSPRTPSATATDPSAPSTGTPSTGTPSTGTPATGTPSTGTVSSAPSQPSFPASTPPVTTAPVTTAPVTTAPAYPSGSSPSTVSQAPSAGSGSNGSDSGSADSNSGGSGSSSRSGQPLWPLWPFGG